MRRLVPFSPAILGAYVTLAVAAFCTAWRDPAGRWIGGDFDPVLFIWHLRWMPFALSNGHDPFISNYLNYPDGFNLMWNTSILLPSFLLSPVTLLLGVIVAYNILATLALALSAWCAYFAFRRYVRREAAALGALLYGFSPFMFSQAANHPHMTLALFPPLALILLDEILVRQRRSPLVMGAVLGAAAALQLLTGEEILAMTVLVAAVGIALLAVLHRSDVRRRVGYAARALGIAALVALAISSYPLGVQLFGAQHVAASSGPVQTRGTFILDAAELVVPTQRQELTFSRANHLGQKYNGQSEINGYVGVPLLLLAAFVVFRYRDRRLVLFAGTLAVATTLLAFGPRLTVGGHTLPLPLPWVIPQRVPLFHNILPARIMLFTFLLLALLVAVFADRSRLPRLAVVAVVAVAFVPIVPNLPYPSTASASPRFFEDGAHEIPAGSVAVVAPLAGVSSGTTQPMVWQVAADMRFRMPGGYVIRRSSVFALPATDLELFRRIVLYTRDERAPPLTDAAGSRIRCALLRLRARTVVVGPMDAGRRKTTDLFRHVLHENPIHRAGVDFWPDVLVVARRGGDHCP